MIKHRLRTSVVAFSAVVALVGTPALPLFTSIGVHADSTSAYETLNSFSGYPAAALTVSGGNYAALEPISISAVEGTSLLTTVTTTAATNGTFSVGLTLPTKLSQGSVTITATGTKSGLAATNNYYVNPFTPALQVSASDTTPYGALTVSGSGYAANENVDLNFAGAITEAQTNASGSFSKVSVTTPNVPAASYQLVGVGESSGASAVSYEYVNGFYASASPSSYYVMPATTLAFNGSGFAANETITVTDSLSATPITAFNANASGSFTNGGSFTVPASYAGLSKTFVLTGSLSHATASVTTTVGKYYPSVSPTIYYVMPGKTISFNGSGFLPGEAVTITNGTTTVSTAVADAKGNLVATGTVTVPANEAGTTQTYTLTGKTSMGSGSVSVQIGNYNPQVSPSGYYVMPGSVLLFSGSGYAPNETVAIFNGLSNVGSITADNTGSFLAGGNILINYNQANSSASYKLVGSVSNEPINFTIGVGQLNTQITPSDYYVLPYQLFSVKVSGFAPNENMTLTNGLTKLATTVTSPLGVATFTNVSLPAGISSATLVATGSTSNATATATIGVGNYNPSVTADNYYVKPGTVVTLTGTGFAPSEPVTVTAGTTTTTVTTDLSGDFTSPVTVPFGQTKNTVAIVSTGTLSQASSTTTLTLAPYTPQVSPSTYYAQPGTPISFTGSGFVPNESIIVNLNGKNVGTETANAKGLLVSTNTYALPFGTAAVYTLTGQTSGAVNTMSIGLAQFYAGVQLSSYYGDGGSVVTATGTGFAPNELVTLTSGKTILGSITTTTTGSFSKAITIPYVAPGALPIVATGTSSAASATTGYTVATVYNGVQLSQYALPAGSAVTFIGDGYYANEPVTVTTDRTTGSYTLKASTTGTFTDSGYVLPSNLAPGMLTFTITGTESFTVHTITMYVQSAS
jgi:hypothetical protein